MRTVAAAILACLAQATPLLAAAQQQQPLPPGGYMAPPAPQPSPYIRTAPPQSSPVSLALRVGMYSPSDNSDTSMMSIFDDGLDVEATVGIQVHPNVAIEGGIGYYRTSSDTLSFYDPSSGATMDAKFGLSVIPITASLRLGGQVDRLSFYGLAGVGIHMAKLEADATISDPFYGTESATVSDDASVFGLHIGAGIGLQISQNASIGVEIRRTFVEATLMDEDLDLGGVRLGATLAFRL